MTRRTATGPLSIQEPWTNTVRIDMTAAPLAVSSAAKRNCLKRLTVLGQILAAWQDASSPKMLQTRRSVAGLRPPDCERRSSASATGKRLIALSASRAWLRNCSLIASQ